MAGHGEPQERSILQAPVTEVQWSTSTERRLESLNTPELEQKALNLAIFIQWCLHRKLTTFLVLVKDLSKYVFHPKFQFPRKKTLWSGEYCILSPFPYMAFHLELFLRKSKQQALIIDSYFLGLFLGEMKWVYREKGRIWICFLVKEPGMMNQNDVCVHTYMWIHIYAHMYVLGPGATHGCMLRIDFWGAQRLCVMLRINLGSYKE